VPGLLPPPTAPKLASGAAAGGQLGPVLWRGCIVKQQVRLCGVACLEGGLQGAAPHMCGSAVEPQGWPDQLHVNYRISVDDAVEQYTNALPEQRAVRRLLPLDPGKGDAQKLKQFIDYLILKDRAGMVKLPGVRELRVGPRAVYLIVPQPKICQQLQVAWDSQDVMLIAVVVPQPGLSGGPADHGGHRQHR